MRTCHSPHCELTPGCPTRKAWQRYTRVPIHMSSVSQGMRQSYSDNRVRQFPSEPATANGKQSVMWQTHPEPRSQAQHASQRSAQHEPPRISADHQFLSGDDNSGSGSDEDHVGAEARKQHRRIAADHAAAKQQAPAPAAAAREAQRPHPTASPPVQVVAVQQPSHEEVHSYVPKSAKDVDACCSLLRAVYTAFLPSAQAFNGLSLLDMSVGTPPETSKDGEQSWDRLDGSNDPLQAAAPPQSQASSYNMLACAEARPPLCLTIVTFWCMMEPLLQCWRPS